MSDFGHPHYRGREGPGLNQGEVLRTNGHPWGVGQRHVTMITSESGSRRNLGSS